MTTLFKSSANTGTVHEIDSKSDGYRLHFENSNGRLFQGDSLEWLTSLPTSSVDLIFADPPYNIKKAEWDTFENQEEYIKWSMIWIEQAARVLKDTGSMYVCGFSEILADLKHPSSRFFEGTRWIVWHYKNKANLRNDWGRSHESLLHLRKTKRFTFNVDDIRIPYGAHTLKYPDHPQAESSAYGGGKIRPENWKPHPLGAKPKDVIEVPTTCNGMGETTPHPTQKPEELVRKFVLSSSNKGDTVLDPFSGSGTTITVAEQLERKWMACEQNLEYNTWAIRRMQNVRHMSVNEWIAYDRMNKERREKIR